MTTRLAVLAVLAVLCTFSSAQAALPDPVPFQVTQQGRLLKNDGTPATGTVKMTFALYANPSGGTALWTESQDVVLDDGYFAVQLGAKTALSSSLWDGATRHIGLAVGADSEMTPREVVVSVPYAVVAGNAVGDITPRSVTVNGKLVIDATGKVQGGGSTSAVKSVSYTAGSWQSAISFNLINGIYQAKMKSLTITPPADGTVIVNATATCNFTPANPSEIGLYISTGSDAQNTDPGAVLHLQDLNMGNNPYLTYPLAAQASLAASSGQAMTISLFATKLNGSGHYCSGQLTATFSSSSL